MSSGCGLGVAAPGTGTIRVHTSATGSEEVLTAYLRSPDGRIVAQTSGPGVGWDGVFAEVPVGRYLVQLQIEGPTISSAAAGVATSSAVVTQAPFPVVVTQGSSTVLTYDGAAWTAVQ